MTQFKKEVTTLRVNKLALAVALGLSLGLTGCGDDKSVSTAVGVPNPNTLMPTGTIQGRLVDAVTNEPIVGAVVDIGIAKATTTETGQFVIANVPATKNIGAAAAGENTPYQVTIDLRNVKQAAGAAKYPNFSFSTAAVTYSSLNDGSNDAGTSSSNHDTPVTGLTAPLSLTVGKLAAGIKGTVAKAMDFKAVGAGYTVKLVSVGSSNSTTGATGPLDGRFLNGNVVATTTTDASGAFVFSGIESLRDFQIEVVNADATEYGSEPVRAPADGQVKTLLAQRGEDALDLRTVLVKSTDTLAPRVVKSTPETGTERAPGANVAVTFSFSEPIISNGLTNSLTASTAGNGGLYDKVTVEFEGIKDIAMKASNIPYSLAWDATRTQLTVVIPKVKASAKYKVSIAGAASILLDNQGYATEFAFEKSTSANTGEVKFSTNAEGATKPAAVSTLAINNNADLDQTNNAVVDWLPVSGAKGYHVYRAKFVNDVMDSKGYEPLKPTGTADAAAAAAQRDAKQVIADAAKTAATTAAQVSVQAGQNVDIADVKANTAIKAAAPTTGAVADATAASAALTAPAATDARAADKVAALSVVSDKDSASKVSAANNSAMIAAAAATSSNRATATIAKDKVKGVNDAVVAASGMATAAATAATTANTNVRTVNTKAMVAAKVAATVNAVADVAAAISAVSAADSSVALANLNAAQAAVDADPSNQAKLNVLAIAQTAFNNANKPAVDKAKEAKVAADAAKKALDAAIKAKDDAMDAAAKANADSVTAANAVESAKITAEGKATANTTAQKELTTAQKALTDAQKALTDAQKALTDANTAAEKEDAAVDLQKAKDAVETAKVAANKATAAAVLADRLADEAAAAAVAAADALTASTAAAKAATDAATAATAAVAAITTAVNAADAAADNVDLATASSAANNATFEVLDNNAKIVDGWRAYTAAAVAKAMAAAKVVVVTDAESAAAKTAVADAAKKAADVVKMAQDIVAKATIAKTAVAATQTAAAAAVTKAVSIDSAAKTAATNAKVPVTTAATALTTAANAATTTAVVKTAVADAIAAVGTANAKTTADAAEQAALGAAVTATTTDLFNAVNVAKAKADDAKWTADAVAVGAAAGSPAALAAAEALAAATNAGTALTDATKARTAALSATTNAQKTAALTDATKAATAASTAATAAAAAATKAATAAVAGSPAATAANNAAAAATNAATAAANTVTAATNAANVVGKVNNLIKAQLVEKNATDAAAAAATALIKANDAKTAADTALTDVTAAKTAADKALVDANTAKLAADKLVTSMNAAETSLKSTVVANAAAVKATADALTASNDAVTAAKTAASAAASKQQADKALATAVKDKAAADKALADAQGVVDSNGGYVANSNMDQYLTQNTSFVEDSSKQFIDGIRKVTYKYTVRAVSEDNVESDAGNEVEAKDNTKPKVSSFTMNTASNVVTVVFSEPMNELDFRNQANYVLSAPTGTTVTLPALSNALFKIDSKTVVLSYASNIPAGSTVTVKGLKDLAGNAMSEVGNTASVSKVSSNIAGFIGSTQVTVFFSAEMDKASAETAANYALPTGPALLASNGVVYNSGNNSVTLTYVSAIPAGVTLTVSGVKDANGTVVESNTKQFN